MRRRLVAGILLCMCVSTARTATLPTIYHWDLRGITSQSFGYQYDYRHFAACVQGLVNRDAPRLFVSYTTSDYTWFTRLRESGGICEGWQVVTITKIGEVISLFGNYINGVILYDPDPNTGVISTSLVATTAAGVEGGIALRKNDTVGSLYQYLVVSASGPKLPVLIDLTGKFTGTGTIWQTTTPSTGSKKCDAYIWAKQKYLDTGKCDTTTLMYTFDLWGCRSGAEMETQLSNLDYAVKKKAFCFELSMWGDEKPNDDPSQPLGTDLNTFKALLNACNIRNNYSKMIKFCGFVNWAYKYTSYTGGLHAEVQSEWEMMRLLSAYNTYSEADAQLLLANASFYNGLLPLLSSRRYVQNPAPTYNDMVTKGYINGSTGAVNSNHYVLLYMGDYDSAYWPLYWMVLLKYDTPQRGQIDCSWAVNPNAVDRVSVAMDYIYRHKTSRDFFIGGDSGAGYVHPTQLYGARNPSGYSSAVNMWKTHCMKYYRMFDYSITGWLLNSGSGGTLTNTDVVNYSPFSGDGVGFNDGTPSSIVNNVPVRTRVTVDNPTASDISNAYGSGVQFHWWRTILWKPSDVLNIQNALGSQHKLVDAYTFYYLYRYYNGGNNNYRATWVNDTIPRIMAIGKTYQTTVTVRNDGWDTWTEASAYRLGYAIVGSGTDPSNADYDLHGRFTIPTGTSVAPGQTSTFTVIITAPAVLGNYDLYYDMVRDGFTWFRTVNNIPWKKEIIVAAKETDVDTDGDGVPDVIEDRAGMLYWHPDDQTQCGDLGYLTSDISGAVGSHDCYVNMFDLTVLVSQWLNDGTMLSGDIGGLSGLPDGQVDFDDFAILALQWLQCSDPHNSSCW